MLFRLFFIAAIVGISVWIIMGLAKTAKDQKLKKQHAKAPTNGHKPPAELTDGDINGLGEEGIVHALLESGASEGEIEAIKTNARDKGGEANVLPALKNVLKQTLGLSMPQSKGEWWESLEKLFNQIFNKKQTANG